jgi:hypothetical protein
MTDTSLDPRGVFELLATELPAEVLDNVVVIGSLAAACFHADKLVAGGVKTKDADLVVHPAGNRTSARTIAETLRARGWRAKHGSWQPGTASTPVTDLPAIRLYPPDHERYFVELLIVPDGEQPGRRPWLSVEVDGGWYCLPSFEFLALALVDRQRFTNGVHYAHPRMMALANLLSHPQLGEDVMSSPIGGREIHRSSKDLGRVLAIAQLETRAETETWAAHWQFALAHCFPTRWPTLARDCGAGMRALRDDDERFEEAHHCADQGLLAGKRVTLEQLRATTDQLLVDVIEPVEAAGRAGLLER